MARRVSTTNTELKARIAAHRKQVVTEVKEREARELARIESFPERDRFEARRAIACRDTFDIATERTIASNVRYDPTAQSVIVELENGCTFHFPPRQQEFLAKRSDAFLADVCVRDGSWLLFGSRQPGEPAAQQVHILQLLMGRFGTKKFMVRKKAGKVEAAKSLKPRARQKSTAIEAINHASDARLIAMSLESRTEVFPQPASEY